MDNQENQTHILIVDDEAGMREGCRRVLAPRGYRIDTAATFTSALELIQTQNYDLLLLDAMLPDGNGLDLIAPALERDPDAICIVITGFGSIGMAVEAIQKGAYNFLSKPFTADELTVAVNQGLERRRLKAVEREATELSRAKEELEKLDQIKSQFMLKVAHELRAPLAAIQSYINLVLAGYLSEDEMQSTLTRVQARLQEALDMVADLLQLARLKQAKDQLLDKASPQPAAKVLEEVCDLLREQARSKQQRLEVKIQARPTVVIHRDHLRQIWTNLISNAIKYTPPGGQITVTLGTDDNHLVSSVEDSGIGISEEDLPNLFQEFFRTAQAKASGEIGTGLGLSIVKQIIESYHGTIQVTSRLGQGSRFLFSLPLSPPPTDIATAHS